MDKYHSISISVDQLLQWQDGQSEHLRNLASAAVLASLDSELYGAVVRDVAASAGGFAHDSTVSRLDSKDDDFTALVWIRGEDIRMAASIEKPDLVSLRELVKMVMESNFDEGEAA